MLATAQVYNDRFGHYRGLPVPCLSTQITERQDAAIALIMLKGGRLSTYDNNILTCDMFLTAVYIEYTAECFTGIFTGSQVKIFERD